MIKKFIKLAGRIQRNIMYSEKERDFIRAISFLSATKRNGTFAEFGVDKGRSAISLYKMAKRLHFDMEKIYLFDSFEGLPEPEKEDQGMPWKEGDYSCTVEEVKNNLIKAKLPMDRVKMIDGYYEKSLKKKHDHDKFSLINIDCDYYSSTKEVLNYIKDFLQDGTIIIFDDWFAYNGSDSKGERRAFIEWDIEDFDFIELPCEALSSMFITRNKPNIEREDSKGRVRE